MSEPSENSNLVIYGMKSPDHTYNHICINFSLWQFVSRFYEILLCCFNYSVMQSDGNSLKIDTIREAITSELMI